MTQPDIIFIVLDTQRADRLGCYGNKRDISPNLDHFAQQGVLFEQAISPAQWTIPSHGSLFTGHYPTVHQVLQSAQSLSPNQPHLAELMGVGGYETIGFCNNPLVGVLDNGYKRGFETFYNYGGAFPSVPESSTSLPWPLNWVVTQYTQFLRRISYPIQNFVGRSDLAFRVSLNAWLTPIWSKMANFKGQNERSVQDVAHFLQQRDQTESEKPLLLFLNLMETHLPFWPPGKFIDKIAPYFRESKEARTIMQNWNREAYRWAAPLAEPLGELEAQVLSDLYDAEVAYQDDYLGQLFEVINGRSNRNNTLTVIVSDHGDGLGEHNYFGHAFVAYQELVHVPLIMHWPEKIAPDRITTPVSTRRVFHTILDNAGQIPNHDTTEAKNLSLQHTIAGHDPENGTAYSEIYPPINFVRAIESRQPELLEQFRCLSLRRAIVQEEEDGTTFKLIQVDDEADEMFELIDDPLEEEDLLEKRPSVTTPLNQELTKKEKKISSLREQQATGGTIEMDESLMQQLRGLGYID